MAGTVSKRYNDPVCKLWTSRGTVAPPLLDSRKGQFSGERF
jgi:hypothetical protein